MLKAIGINFENCDLTSAIFFYPKAVFNNQNNSSDDVKEFFNSSSTIIDSSIIYEDQKPPKVLLYDTSDEKNHRRVDTIEISVDPACAYEWVFIDDKKYRRFIQSGEWIDEPQVGI